MQSVSAVLHGQWLLELLGSIIDQFHACIRALMAAQKQQQNKVPFLALNTARLSDDVIILARGCSLHRKPQGEIVPAH